MINPVRQFGLAGAFSLLLASAHAQLSFTTAFTGGTTQEQTATTDALTRLSSFFTSTINLKVQVTIGNLGTTGTLGSSSADFSLRTADNLFYATPLFNLLTGTNLDGSGSAPSITISMNNNASVNWGYGTGAPGVNFFSWQTVITHEILHSMGFYDGIANNTGALANAGYTIFDSFTIQNTASPVNFTSFTTDGQRQSAILSNDLFWNGAFGKAANGGNPVKLYAPATFEAGSTYSHIDPSLTGIGGTLFPTLADNVFFAGPTAVELGIIRDIGWSVSAVPEPSTYVLILGAASLAFVVVRRRSAA